MLKLLLCLIFLFSLFGCNSSTENNSAKQDPQIEQFAVYKAVITDSQSGIYYRKIFIEKNTIKAKMSDYQLLTDNFRELDKATLSDYIEGTKNTVALADNFNLDSEIVFVDRSDFSGKQSSQSIAFSNAGFNNEMNQALVYLEIINDRRTSAGQFLLLFKENEKWKVKEKFAVWME